MCAILLMHFFHTPYTSAQPTTTTNTTLTYTNTTAGFSIRYPSTWTIQPYEPTIIGPAKIVDFALQSNKSNNYGFGSKPLLDADLSITIENVSKYLDTNTMTVKTHPLQDYVNNQINIINSLSIPTGNSGLSGLTETYLKSQPITISGSPATMVFYTSSYGGIPGLFHIDTYMIKNSKLYTFHFFSDQLKVPETFPVAQKMLASFKVK